MAKPSLTVKQVQARRASASKPGFGAAAPTPIRGAVAQTVPKGQVRIYQADRPDLKITARVVGPVPTFTAEGFGGHEQVPLVIGRPATDFTEPAAMGLTIPGLLFDEARRRRSVEADCQRLELWAKTRATLRVAGLVPAGAPAMLWVFGRGGLAPSTEPARVWWARAPSGTDYRIRQGYEVTLMETRDERIDQERPVTRARRVSEKARADEARSRATTQAALAVALARARARKR